MALGFNAMKSRKVATLTAAVALAAIASACGNETGLEHQSMRSYEPEHTVSVMPEALTFATLSKGEAEQGVVTVRATGAKRTPCWYCLNIRRLSYRRPGIR